MKPLALPLLLLALAAPAHALGVGVRGGTNGIGGDIGFDIAPTLLGRVGYSGLNLSQTIDDTDVRYDGKVKLNNLSALVDFSPLGPFRLTGGVVYAKNRIGLTGRPTNGTYELNGTQYNAADIGSVTGSVEGKRKLAPYVGVGYGNVSGLGVNFYTDIGVILQGGGKAALNVQCGSAISASQCTKIRQDAEAERTRLQDDVSKFKAWPVISLGLTIGF
ncbi:hypothetical protein [Chitinimonas sp. BJYL2]|uniref:hypothetical protein n=1 Tax=Chitinimonas sp. BJYL2 TaxID=2976696 RepID=UPI0022B3E132|nr:hypothetical protein [Chitinimonas sp. BJYL2]